MRGVGHRGPPHTLASWTTTRDPFDHAPRGAMRLLGLAVVIIVAWVLLFPAPQHRGSLFALALYVIIAFVAYQVGKAVGRSSRD